MPITEIVFMMLVSSCCRKSPLAEPGFDMVFQYAHKITAYLSQILYRWEVSDVNTLFGDFGLDLWSRTNRASWYWSMHNLKEFSRSNNYAPGPYLKCTLLQEHVCYGPGAECFSNMVLEHIYLGIFFKIIILSRTIRS